MPIPITLLKPIFVNNFPFVLPFFVIPACPESFLKSYSFIHGRPQVYSGAERLAGAKRANAGTKTKSPAWRAVASPQGQQPPADGRKKSG